MLRATEVAEDARDVVDIVGRYGRKGMRVVGRETMRGGKREEAEEEGGRCSASGAKCCNGHLSGKQFF